jgi:hypothetical protein
LLPLFSTAMIADYTIPPLKHSGGERNLMRDEKALDSGDPGESPRDQPDQQLPLNAFSVDETVHVLALLSGRDWQETLFDKI